MSVERVIASITEDRRTDYLWETKLAAPVAGMVPNKFKDWWMRNREKLEALARRFPAETAAELALILARAASEERSREPGARSQK
jgi:hypothetical protein